MAEQRDRLALQALLYLTDALPGNDHLAFEERLGEDQKAREALSLAVAFVQSCNADAPRPDPAYRRAVLSHAMATQPRLRWWQSMWQRRQYHGHPAIWSGLGATLAAAILLWLGALAPSSNQAPEMSGDTQLVAAAKDPADAEVARTWATLPRSQHLFKSHEDVQKRKARDQARERLKKS